MSFESVLLSYLGGADDAWDIRVAVRRCFFFDFEGAPARLWDGVGRLTTTTAVGDPLTLASGDVIPATDWLGTRDGKGRNALSAPEIADDRDGKAPVHKFQLRSVGKEIFDALKGDQDKVRGRKLTIYDVIVPQGEGLLPQTEIRFNTRLTMQGADFSESLQAGDGGEHVRVYSASVSCRSGEAGRSRTPRGTYTDTCQRDRAALLGISDDTGCIFVAKNSQRTFRTA